MFLEGTFSTTGWGRSIKDKGDNYSEVIAIVWAFGEV